MSKLSKDIQSNFFKFLFREEDGYICIATSEGQDKKSFRQHFFKWPDSNAELVNFIEKNTRQQNVWFCVNLLGKEERKKEYCLPTNLVWADLDECNPVEVRPVPQCVIESSPDRYQAIWRVTDILEPEVASKYSKKVAYFYAKNGADVSGWDLTQLLRVPLTRNYKYKNAPKVELISSIDGFWDIAEFEQIDAPDNLTEDIEEYPDVPDPLELPEPEQIIYKFLHNLNKSAFKQLYTIVPEKTDDWSKLMWRLINICIEAGMTDEETFSVALSASCNKYARDDRPIRFLWREVIKADRAQARLTLITGEYRPLVMPEISTGTVVPEMESFINDYLDWGQEATDALPQYHELGSFIALSSILAQNVRLKTTYGDMIPNLWGLVLGDSTLTRKTTAMRMAVDLIQDLDQDMILATDGSVEGLLQGLSTRPSMTSIFYKDEVSGFFDSINRKDYLAGMQETLTQLYDVPRIYTRRLRKETITISSPIFIFFGGGIKEKVYSLVSDEYVLSGFLPRFLIVSGDADLASIRTTGPATKTVGNKRQKVVGKLADLMENYVRKEEITIVGQKTTVDAVVEAILTKDAWEVYGDIETQMVKAASGSPLSLLALPTFERLSRSLLKMSILIAASRQVPDNGKISINAQDVEFAATFIQKWGTYTIELIQSSGRSTTQRIIDKILNAIERNPGISRGKLMQSYKLLKREMDEIQATLEDRGQIRIQREGRGVRLWAN